MQAYRLVCEYSKYIGSRDRVIGEHKTERQALSVQGAAFFRKLGAFIVWYPKFCYIFTLAPKVLHILILVHIPIFLLTLVLSFDISVNPPLNTRIK